MGRFDRASNSVAMSTLASSLDAGWHGRLFWSLARCLLLPPQEADLVFFSSCFKSLYVCESRTFLRLHASTKLWLLVFILTSLVMIGKINFYRVTKDVKFYHCRGGEPEVKLFVIKPYLRMCGGVLHETENRRKQECVEHNDDAILDQRRGNFVSYQIEKTPVDKLPSKLPRCIGPTPTVNCINRDTSLSFSPE